LDELDRAYSVSKYADLSALIVGQIKTVEGKNALVVIDTKMERLKESDLVKATVDLIGSTSPHGVHSRERIKTGKISGRPWSVVVLFGGIVCPYFRWINIDNTEKAFARPRGRLWSCHSATADFGSPTHSLNWNNYFSSSNVSMVRKRSGNSVGSKDDGVAALSLMWQEARSLHHVEVIKDDAKKQSDDDLLKRTR